MTEKPDISVVMSVYNDAERLRESMDSILSQENVNLEFIVVNDGSTDSSREVLHEYASKDRRVRIIVQDNMGLTKALIKGCSIARGKYIARQDAGDVSLPNRLHKQLCAFLRNPNAVLVSCGTRFVGPEGEYLYEVFKAAEYRNGNGRQSNGLTKTYGPSSHPSATFRRSAYELVGGYRQEFYFAQDRDLWLRLMEVGVHMEIEEILYQASITPNSLSGMYRKEQVELKKLILEGIRMRRQGLSDELMLKQAHKLRPSNNHYGSRVRKANTLYFIGSCLQATNRKKARAYFMRAVRIYPMHIKSWLRLLKSVVC